MGRPDEAARAGRLPGPAAVSSAGASRGRADEWLVFVVAITALTAAGGSMTALGWRYLQQVQEAVTAVSTLFGFGLALLLWRDRGARRWRLRTVAAILGLGALWGACVMLLPVDDEHRRRMPSHALGIALFGVLHAALVVLPVLSVQRAVRRDARVRPGSLLHATTLLRAFRALVPWLLVATLWEAIRASWCALPVFDVVCRSFDRAEATHADAARLARCAVVLALALLASDLRTFHLLRALVAKHARVFRRRRAREAAWIDGAPTIDVGIGTHEWIEADAPAPFRGTARVERLVHGDLVPAAQRAGSVVALDCTLVILAVAVWAGQGAVLTGASTKLPCRPPVVDPIVAVDAARAPAPSRPLAALQPTNEGMRLVVWGTDAKIEKLVRAAVSAAYPCMPRCATVTLDPESASLSHVTDARVQSSVQPDIRAARKVLEEAGFRVP